MSLAYILHASSLTQACAEKEMENFTHSDASCQAGSVEQESPILDGNLFWLRGEAPKPSTRK